MDIFTLIGRLSINTNNWLHCCAIILSKAELIDSLCGQYYLPHKQLPHMDTNDENTSALLIVIWPLRLISSFTTCLYLELSNHQDLGSLAFLKYILTQYTLRNHALAVSRVLWSESIILIIRLFKPLSLDSLLSEANQILHKNKILKYVIGRW